MNIRVKNLSFKYDTNILKDIDLQARENEVLGIMGKNGSGKTTLLKILAGLLDPDSGKVHYYKRSKDPERGFSPEDPELGFFSDTVKEEVEFYPENLGLEEKKRANDALEELGIQHLEEKTPFTLSAGQQRLVSIASVLSGEPDALILDEPTHGLNWENQKLVGESIRNIDKTLVLSTHSSDFAYKYTDKLAVMFNGKILCKGKTKDVMRKTELLKRTGIRIPGLINWAQENSVVPPPDDIDEAAKLVREDKV